MSLALNPDDVARLVGRTIVGATTKDQYDRTDALALTLDNGTVATISFWAAYADDSSLELEFTEDAA